MDANVTEYVQPVLDQLPNAFWVYWYRLNLIGLRRFFYLVPPSESTFEHAEDVPDWPDEALIWFGTIATIETMLVMMLKPSDYRSNDGTTATMAGLITMLYTIFHKGVNVALYAWVYNNFRIVDLPWDATWVWVLCFFTQDFMAYWSHRAMHEISIFWAFHQMHHNSQYFNIWVSLRLSILQPWVASLFEAVNAIAIPPGTHLAHSHLNLLYQFWLHTKLIPSLGPIEWVFNTPYLHRVHHARNPKYIDKNYGVVLIVWDRIFGTFETEDEEDPCVYGIVQPVNTFNMFYLQAFYYKYVLFDKPWFELPKGTSLKDRLLSYVYPIGWIPGKKLKWFVWWSLEDPIADVPEAAQYHRHMDPPRLRSRTYRRFCPRR